MIIYLLKPLVIQLQKNVIIYIEHDFIKLKKPLKV